MNSEQKRK